MTVTSSKLHCFLDSNLKKAEETVTRLETEIAENEKLMEELTEQLKKLEDQAGEIMKSCQEAEVCKWCTCNDASLCIHIHALEFLGLKY